MLVRVIITAIVLTGVAAWSDPPPPWPVSGPVPDEPIAIPKQSYVPVNAGVKGYEPVEPMPWGDVNRRVTPKQSQSKSNPQGHDAH